MEEFCDKERLVNFAYELSHGTDQAPDYEINFQHNCSNDHRIRCLKSKQAHVVLTIGLHISRPIIIIMHILFGFVFLAVLGTIQAIPTFPTDVQALIRTTQND
ncbi:hypothetical protein B9Z55_007167 [Caenorhabditis nigoni]|uniref:Uncharacterized protein n=1 Tax=Caenorhabditis nigoni TaxID=1611254 RepID=A0A2G5V8C2_9PELO|nr:hypothetical protein B9Z55_007167 [Caenorhabditis nigoni]